MSSERCGHRDGDEVVAILGAQDLGEDLGDPMIQRCARDETATEFGTDDNLVSMGTLTVPDVVLVGASAINCCYPALISF